jgi:hypothetical protein
MSETAMELWMDQIREEYVSEHERFRQRFLSWVNRPWEDGARRWTEVDAFRVYARKQHRLVLGHTRPCLVIANVSAPVRGKGWWRYLMKIIHDHYTSPEVMAKDGIQPDSIFLESVVNSMFESHLADREWAYVKYSGDSDRQINMALPIVSIPDVYPELEDMS